MVNWKGFSRKGCSLKQYAEIYLEKPERKKKRTQQSMTVPRFEPYMP